MTKRERAKTHKTAPIEEDLSIAVGIENEGDISPMNEPAFEEKKTKQGTPDIAAFQREFRTAAVEAFREINPGLGGLATAIDSGETKVYPEHHRTRTDYRCFVKDHHGHSLHFCAVIQYGGNREILGPCAIDRNTGSLMVDVECVVLRVPSFCEEPTTKQMFTLTSGDMLVPSSGLTDTISFKAVEHSVAAPPVSGLTVPPPVAPPPTPAASTNLTKSLAQLSGYNTLVNSLTQYAAQNTNVQKQLARVQSQIGGAIKQNTVDASADTVAIQVAAKNAAAAVNTVKLELDVIVGFLLVQPNDQIRNEMLADTRLAQFSSVAAYKKAHPQGLAATATGH